MTDGTAFWLNQISGGRAPVAPPPRVRTWFDATQPPQAVQPVGLQTNTPVQPMGVGAPVSPAGDVIALPVEGVEGMGVRPPGYTKSQHTCPDCGSGNYFAPPGQAGRARCFDCGHNPWHTQSGQGVAVPNNGGQPAAPARQVAHGGAGGQPAPDFGSVVART